MDNDLWNSIVSQKDSLYFRSMKHATFRLQKKFSALLARTSIGGYSRSPASDAENEHWSSPFIAATDVLAPDSPVLLGTVSDVRDLSTTQRDCSFLLESAGEYRSTPVLPVCGACRQDRTRNSDLEQSSPASIPSEMLEPELLDPPVELDRAFVESEDSEDSSEDNHGPDILDQAIEQLMDQSDQLNDSPRFVVNPQIPIPLPAPPPADDGLLAPPGELAWGENVPFIRERDPHLCKEIINLSGLPLTVHQTELLKLGLRFHATPKFVPQLKLMAGIEAAASDLRRQSPEQSDWFQTDAARLLHHAKRPIPNLSKDLQKASKELCSNSDLVITAADKGGRTVLLHANQYAELCGVHLEDQAYQLVESFGSGRFRVSLTDPRTSQNKEILNDNFLQPDVIDRLLKLQCNRLRDLLTNLAAQKEMPQTEVWRLSPLHPYLGTIPCFYGLPKVHKIAVSRSGQ